MSNVTEKTRLPPSVAATSPTVKAAESLSLMVPMAVSESSTKPLLAVKLTTNVSAPSSTASSVVVTVNCFVSPAAPVKLSVTAELSKSTPPVAVSLAGGVDFDNSAVTLNFTGAAGETKQFTVTTTDDAVLEGAETFGVSLTASNGLIDDSDTAIGTINDNDSAALTVGDVAVTEGGSLVFSVTLDKAVQGAFSVDVGLANDTATGGVDFDNSAVTLNFTGAAGETKQFTVTTTDDAVLEGAETFVVSLTASNGLVDDSDTAIGTINDNDSAALTVGDVAATEGGSLVFSVTLDKAVQGAFSVDVGLANGTATGGVDFDNSAVTLNFTGAAGETKQFTVTTTDDAVLEGAETFGVSLTASNGLIDDSDTAIGTINDNDSAALTVGDVAVTEGGSLVFSVTLDKAVQGAFSVDVGLANDTATGGVDFDNSAVTLNFTGAAGETKQFTVTTTDDAVLEGAETFVVRLDGEQRFGRRLRHGHRHDQRQ